MAAFISSLQHHFSKCLLRPFSSRNMHAAFLLILACQLLVLSSSITGVHAINRKPELKLDNIAASGNSGPMASETTTLKSLFGLLEVIDKNTGPEGQVKCSLENDYIALNTITTNYYKLVLKKKLDREKAPLVEVKISCTDGGSPPLTSEETFTITVTDSNDNAPVFTQAVYRFAVQENSANRSVGQVHAVDADEGQNAVLMYSLENMDGNIPTRFIIDKNTGSVVCTSQIDRETENEIILYVNAADKGESPLVGKAELRISITDENDNIPQILTKDLFIDEGLKRMSEVGVLKAADNDTGLNSNVSFQLLRKGQTPFIVSSGGQVTSIVSLDRELLDTYTITVVVMDKGTPALSSTSDITITVRDVNDHGPVIVFPTEKLDVLNPGNNNSSVGNDVVVVDWFNPSKDKIVIKISATDADVGDNGHLSYSIESINSKQTDKDSLFNIDQYSGEVFLNRRIRSGDDPVQVLSFLVEDGGVPPRNASTNVNVTLDVDFELIATLPDTTPMSSLEKPLNHAVKLNCTFWFTTFMFILFTFVFPM